MINQADWRQTVQTVLTLIQDVDVFNAVCSTPCNHFRLNPLEMLLVLDVLHSAKADDHTAWAKSDPAVQISMALIEEAMERYTEYALWLGKLPGRNLPTVIKRLVRVSLDFAQHRARHGVAPTGS